MTLNVHLKGSARARNLMGEHLVSGDLIELELFQTSNTFGFQRENGQYEPKDRLAETLTH